MITDNENGKLHRNEFANPPMMLKYNKRYFADIYMIRLMKNFGTSWKPHRNPNAFVKAKRKFRGKTVNKSL